MKKLTFVVLFAIFNLFLSAEPTNGTWIQSFHRSSMEPQTLGQASVQDDYNAIPPFPFFSFMDFFRPRIMAPFKQMTGSVNHFNTQISSSPESTDDTKIKNWLDIFLLKNDNKTIHIADSKVNESKMNKNTDNITQQKLTTEKAHNIRKKMLEQTSMTPFFDKIYDPLSRIRRFKYLHFKFLGEQNKFTDNENERRLASGNDRTGNFNETGEVTQRILSTDAARNDKKQIAEQMSTMPFLEKMFDPLKRLQGFHFLHLKFFRVNERNKTKEEERTPTEIDKLESINLNKTEMAMLNSSITQRNGNCSLTHHILRYFFVWRINWASVILQVIFILLISLLVTLGVYMCQLAYSNAQIDKQNTDTVKVVKHLTV